MTSDDWLYELLSNLASVGLLVGGGLCLLGVSAPLLTTNGSPPVLGVIGAFGGIVVVSSVVSGHYAEGRLEQDAESTDPPLTREEADELVEHANRFPRVGSYILTRVEDVYSPAETTRITTPIVTPLGVKTWKWDRPILWDAEEDESSFVEFAESRGYSKENFDELEGEPVLAKAGEDKWTIRVGNPADDIAEWIEEGEMEWSEVELTAINEQFDMDIDVEGATVDTESGIIVEELPDDFVPER